LRRIDIHPVSNAITVVVMQFSGGRFGRFEPPSQSSPQKALDEQRAVLQLPII